MQDVDPERIKIACDPRIKARAARHQVTHLVTESLVDRAKENLPYVPAEFSEEARNRHQRADCYLRQFPTLRHFFEDAFVNQIKELRYYGKCSDLAFAQRPKQFGGV